MRSPEDPQICSASRLPPCGAPRRSPKLRDRRFRWYSHRPIQFLSYGLLRAIMVAARVCPPSALPIMGRFLGRIARILDRRHGRIAEKNLARSGGLCPFVEIPEFIDRVYDQLGIGFLEMLGIQRMLEGRAGIDRIRLENFDILDRVLGRGRGAILVVGHLGNWELMGIAVAQAGYRLQSLAHPIDNPWIERYLRSFRSRTGQVIIPKYGALGTMVGALKRNEPLVIQIDQDARQGGVMVDFLGRPASTHRSPAILSLKYGAPIVPVNVFREGDRNHCVITEPIEPEPYRRHPDPVWSLTQEFTRRFEQFVRMHPEQWLWLHDRWRTAERQGRAPASAGQKQDPDCAAPGPGSRRESLPAGVSADVGLRG